MQLIPRAWNRNVNRNKVKISWRLTHNKARRKFDRNSSVPEVEPEVREKLDEQAAMTEACDFPIGNAVAS